MSAERIDVLAVTREMRERHVARHFKSPTLIAWADRIDAAVAQREAAVAELITERGELAARLAEDRAVLDAIRDAVGGGPYDTIARRMAELIEQRDLYENALHLIASGNQRPGHVNAMTKARMAEIARAALARVQGAGA